MAGLDEGSASLLRGSEFGKGSLKLALSRVPAEVGGIALNLAGLGTWIGAMAGLYPRLQPLCSPAVDTVVGLCVALLALSLLKLITVPKQARAELLSLKSCGAHGALLMSLTSSCASGHSAATQTSQRLFCFAAALQVAMALWFLGRARQLRSAPLPIFYPPTVGLAMAGIAGSKAGMSAPLQQAFFCASAALCLAEWPWITARLLLDDRAAAAPSVFIHAAPFSLVALAYMAVFKGELAAATAAANAAAANGGSTGSAGSWYVVRGAVHGTVCGMLPWPCCVVAAEPSHDPSLEATRV
jgi:tellurite resistance protein TehA-like permease